MLLSKFIQSEIRRSILLTVAGAFLVFGSEDAHASDHMDTPTVIADPSADIGDLYGWTSPDGKRLNLVMDLVGYRFSDKLQYVFHIDSGTKFGKTTASALIVCRFDLAGVGECWVQDADYLHADPSDPKGVDGRNKRFRVFAGLRDDPFFNNVRGTRAALTIAGAALERRVSADSAGCRGLDEATSTAMLGQWHQTESGPAKNLLAGWKTASLVISVDLDAVNSGGKLLAVWGSVHKSTETKDAAEYKNGAPPIPTLGEQIERAGRPLTGNALIGLFEAEAISYKRKEQYNRAAPTAWPQFTADIERGLRLYDGFDGKCGNQWLAGRSTSSTRYRALAKVLGDDRLWINSASRVCKQFLSVEFTTFRTSGYSASDCGGRTPDYDTVDILRSLWANGTRIGIDDGVDHDDHAHSSTNFPFLAEP